MWACRCSGSCGTEAQTLSEALSYLRIAAALAAGAIWYLFPGIGLWPLVVGLAPWLLGLAHRRPGALRPATPLDLPLLLFLATSSVGLWATYERDVVRAQMPFEVAVGWQKYGLILAAVLLCLALARLPDARAAWVVTAGLAVAGAAAGVYYMLTQDFAAAPVKFALLNRIGIALQNSRPSLPLHAVGSNQAGAVTAMMAPAGLQLALGGWRSRRRPAGRLALAVALACLALTAAGLALSASRGAWLALAAAFLLWLAWAAGGRLPMLRGHRADRLLAPGFVLFIALIVFRPAFMAFIQGFMGEGINRLELMRLSTLLVRDYPFTGIGLGVYPMVFSTYVLLIHVGFISSPHNLYIELATEQGVAGLIVFAIIVVVTVRLAWIVSGRLATRSRGSLPLAGAGAMLMVMLIHGLVDDPLYARRAALLFLFVAPGLIAGMWRITNPGRNPAPRPTRSHATFYFRLGLALTVLALAAGILARRPLSAVWHANLGALSQTRAELTVYDPAHFGRLTLAAVRRQVDTAAAEAHFSQALAAAPDNVTAAQRLAMLALARGDYTTSLALLERIAAAGAPDRITRLLLADALVANGQPARAAQVVAGLPFAKSRLAGLAYEFTVLGDVQRAAWANEAAAQVLE